MTDDDRSAQTVWAEALAGWSIPDEILPAAPGIPWSYPTELFQRRADAGLNRIDTPSALQAAEALFGTRGLFRDSAQEAAGVSHSSDHRANTLVCPDGKMDLAMQLIFTPMIWRLMKRRSQALQRSHR